MALTGVHLQKQINAQLDRWKKVSYSTNGECLSSAYQLPVPMRRRFAVSFSSGIIMSSRQEADEEICDVECIGSIRLGWYNDCGSNHCAVPTKQTQDTR